MTSTSSINVLDLSDSVIPATRTPGIPWYCITVVLGSVCIIVGVLWDISWHRTIGRDTFWTPAHLAIHLGGLLGGLTCGWLILKATFWGSEAERAGDVRIWGFRGPLGAWVSVWGALAMLTSAPFDDWWHNAYGLDVKIISPPHMVLAVGMWSVVLGALLLVLRYQNNIPADRPRRGQGLFLVAAGILVAMLATVLIEESFPNKQHSVIYYQLSGAAFPVFLIAAARASAYRWAATMIASIYMLIYMLAVWILPLFPGQPLLGPIYNPVDRFVPLPFPHLLVFPAIAIDLLRWWIGPGQGWIRSAIFVGAASLVFLAIFFPTQWFFSEFMLSPGAENWFFGGDRHWGYSEGQGGWRKRYWGPIEPSFGVEAFKKGMGWALLLTFISTCVGLTLGNWMVRVKR